MHAWEMGQGRQDSQPLHQPLPMGTASEPAQHRRHRPASRVSLFPAMTPRGDRVGARLADLGRETDSHPSVAEPGG